MAKSMWLEKFGLLFSPFAKDIPDTDLWMPSKRVSIVEQIVDAIKSHEHVLLVGEPGVGKTCILRSIRNQLPVSDFRLTYCHNATLGRRDFYRHICMAMNIPTKATAAGVFFAIANQVQELGREGVHPCFLLDEAHLLREDVLQHLHVLANYQWDSKPLLSLALVGLPELWPKLQLSSNRSLWSRIHCRVNIGDPDPEDTVEYVEERISRAGGNPGLISSDAFTMLHEATGGRLRDIDRVATASLRRAARRNLKRVDRELINDVVRSHEAPRN